VPGRRTRRTPALVCSIRNRQLPRRRIAGRKPGRPADAPDRAALADNPLAIPDTDRSHKGAARIVVRNRFLLATRYSLLAWPRFRGSTRKR